MSKPTKSIGIQPTVKYKPVKGRKGTPTFPGGRKRKPSRGQGKP